MREVADALGRWDKPALLAFSDTDPVFPFPKAGDRFIEMIPGAEEQVRIEGAAHFLQEDRGEQIAERDPHVPELEWRLAAVARKRAAPEAAAAVPLEPARRSWP